MAGQQSRPMASDTSNAFERAKVRMKMRLLGLLDGSPETPRSNAERQALTETLRQALKTFPDEYRALRLSSDEETSFIQEVINEAVGYGPLEALMTDPSVTEIMVNSPEEIFIERDGQLEQVGAKFRDTNHLMAVIERMLGSVHATVNEASPLCDASLADGSRINVAIPPVVLNGPVLTIRRKARDWTMQDYLTVGALSEQAAQFLEVCVKAKVNIVISGGTSSGKTALVSILASFIPPAHRIITIENVGELELGRRANWIRLVAKSSNLEGRGEIPLRALVKNALRMRPDRIILGEARGGEALDMVQAMHTGHDGFITVLHANSSQAALERLETLMLMSGLDLPPAACRVQIANAVDLVVHVGRFADGSRRVAAITQVLGASQEGFHMQDLFTFEAEGFSPEGQLRGTCRYLGVTPKFISKFQLNNVTIPSWVSV